MLFAAGFGTRMRHLTHNRPKPLVHVSGRPLIDHALDLADAIKPDLIVANLHYRADQLETHLVPRGVQTITETPIILDTGGGLRGALHLLGNGPVFTMNSDAIWTGPNPLLLLSELWDPDKMDALLMCVPIENTAGYQGVGDFSRMDDGRLSRAAGMVYGGVQIIKTDLLDTIHDQVFSLNKLWNLMLSNDRLFGAVYPGQWCDVGHPEGVLIAEKMLGKSNV